MTHPARQRPKRGLDTRAILLGGPADGLEITVGTPPPREVRVPPLPTLDDAGRPVRPNDSLEPEVYVLPGPPDLTTGGRFVYRWRPSAGARG